MSILGGIEPREKGASGMNDDGIGAIVFNGVGELEES